MTSSNSTNQFADKTALVTGANSGLGFEAAAQLAEAGYGRVILACRTLEKARTAKHKLAERVGSDPFETLEVDVSSVKSSSAAGAELVKRGAAVDTLLLNAGMISGGVMTKSDDGLEVAFASSIVGHHVMTLRLLDGGLLPARARVVIAGSESANNDLPAMMDMKLYDFATETPEEFGDNLYDAMVSFAKGDRPDKFNETRYYATTKAFTSWWAAAMARRFGDRIDVFTVSPGANLSTNAARHAKGFKKFLFTKVMPLLGPLMGMGQPISVGAKRYLDVLHGAEGEYVNGKTYTSAAQKFVGPLVEMKHPHLLDIERQDTAWNVLADLTGAGRTQQSSAAE